MIAYLFAWTALQQPDGETLSCESAEHWFATHGEVRTVDGAIEFGFERKEGQYSILILPVLLTNARSIEFDVWSKQATAVVFGLEDRDGARFNAYAELQSGKWRKIKLQPGDLNLSDDSPVKKNRAESRRFGYGLGLVDGGPPGTNVIRVDNVKVVREPLPAVKIPAVVDGRTVEISTDGAAQGPVTVRNGGTLRIRASRFFLSGGVVVEKGTLEIVGSAISLQGRHAHDFRLSAGPGSKIRIADSIVLGNFLHGIGLSEKSRLEIEKTLVARGRFTVDVKEGASVLLDQARGVGEFVISRGTRVTMVDTEGALLWFAPAEAVFKFPDGASIDHWTLPKAAGFEGSLQSCKSISWGILSAPGSRITVEEGAITAIGILFQGEADRLPPTDRVLDVEKATVGTWNLYPMDRAVVSLKKVTFGEVFAFGDSIFFAEDSECDGKGGYVRAEGRASITLRRCRIRCPIVVTDDAMLVLDECVVEKGVTVSGRGTVRLLNTKAAVEKLDKAVIEKK